MRVDEVMVLLNTKGVLDFDMEHVEIELQHINVKLLLRDPAKVDLAAVVPVFHSWIQGQVFDELLLDVADYRHVPDGPGVMLIGHEADYAVDNTDGRLGVRYNRKAPLPGTSRNRLIQATRAALKATERLQRDLNLYFNVGEIDIVINDRLIAPNTEETSRAAEPELRGFLGQLFDEADYELTFRLEPRRLFAITVRAEQEFSVQDLMANLNTASESD